MYPPLKKAIWREFDIAVADHFGIKPTSRAVTRRPYRFDRSHVTPYLVGQFHGTAGGRFSFLAALGRGAEPDSSTNYAEKLECPRPGQVVLVDSYLVLDRLCAFEVDLDWQTPPAKRILEAFAIESAKQYLQILQVTENERHHLLSYEILEAFGVPIQPNDFQHVVERVRPLIGDLVRGPAEQLVAILLSRSDTCNSASCDA